MADKNSGWACTHSASIVAEDNAGVTIRVICYWQNQGWRYDMNGVSAWVYCAGQEVCVKSSSAIDTTGNNQAAYEMGRHDFYIAKTTASQSISCYAKITSTSSYASGTKSSGASSVGVSAKPSYTVSYNANGGAGAPGNQIKWYNTTLTLSSTIPTKASNNFVRWNTNTANTGTGYAPGGSYTGNAALTLYAIWSPYTHTIKYDANGGTGAPSNQTKTAGVQLSISSTVPKKTDYTFLGWSTTLNGAVVYNPGDNYTPDQNGGTVTLYAVWKLAYKKPRITNFTAQRCTSDGTVGETGTYIKIAFDWATDKAVTEVAVQYKLQTATGWGGGTIPASGTSGSISKVVGDGGISTESSYYVRVYVNDSGGQTISNTISIGTVKFPIDVKAGGKGVAIGKVAENNNELDVSWQARFRNNIIVNDKRVAFVTAINNADFNAITSYGSGIFRCAYGCTNAPTNNGEENWHWYLTQNVWGEGTYAHQMVTPVHTTQYIYTRTLINGSWTGWKRIQDTPITLYDNSSGTTGTITLSQSAANFSYLEIFFSQYNDGSRFKSSRIQNPNGKIARIGSWGSTYLYYSDVTFSGTSVTRPSYTKTRISDGASESTNEITIYKILGYK